MIKVVVDFTTPAPHVSESGYPAYLAKFELSNAYPAERYREAVAAGR